MEAIISGTITFVSTLVFFGVVEVTSENTTAWNADYAANYFWSIPADPNGSEAERLAYAALRPALDAGPSELCKLPYK
ncbi:MAG: hypothetical protein HQ481_16025 [Alphaproteobacteria bacterium]|nr:hypothetical protein [Alphaproteobacteria bacterium]